MLKKRKNAYDLGGPPVHDRQASDIPINAVIATVVVDDPYDRSGGRIKATVSLRDDILRHLHERKEIDDALLMAGRKYERLLEIMQVAPLRAMDTTKEPVDGGGWSGDVFTNEQFNAVRDMGAAETKLGERNAKLVRKILHDRMKFKEVSPSLDRYDIAHVRQTFFSCLEDLAELWGLTKRKLTREELIESGRVRDV